MLNSPGKETILTTMQKKILKYRRLKKQFL